MPVTRAAASRAAATPELMPEMNKCTAVEPSKKSTRSRRSRKRGGRSSLVETPAKSDEGGKRTNSSMENHDTSLSTPVKSSPIITPQLARADGYESSDSFEKAIVWSEKKERQQRQLQQAEITTTARVLNPQRSNRSLKEATARKSSKVTYPPVLAAIMAQGLSDYSASGNGAEDKENHSATSIAVESKATTKIDQKNAYTKSSAHLAHRQVDKVRQSNQTTAPATPRSTKPSTASEATSHNRSGIKSVPKKKPTQAVPFSFATDRRAQAKAERKDSSPAKESTRPESPAKSVATHGTTGTAGGPPLVKKRSALFERQQVVKKSISNLSMRSQYSAKLDKNEQPAQQPQEASKRGSFVSTVFRQQNKPAQTKPEPQQELNTKGSRRSLLSSLSFHNRSKANLLKKNASTLDLASDSRLQRSNQTVKGQQQQTPARRPASVYGLPVMSAERSTGRSTPNRTTRRLSVVPSSSPAGSEHSSRGSRSRPASTVATVHAPASLTSRSGTAESTETADVKAASVVSNDTPEASASSSTHQAEMTNIVAYLQNASISGQLSESPLAELEKLRQVASEQGRRTVEMWAARQARPERTSTIEPVRA
ncbi:hypothetical protein BZA70DRAFT_276496 [Myxozyma melibiosi]|uniref:Uncharacterized protein n=1 Tax=Myxozyma melibiosi TaxID=54550 RepID=A0ABR1FB92_9ASCO